MPRSAAIPPRLRRALEAALSPDRARRPATLAPLIDALASPGVPATRTLGGALALAASVALVLLGLRAAAGAGGNRRGRHLDSARVRVPDGGRRARDSSSARGGAGATPHGRRPPPLRGTRTGARGAEPARRGSPRRQARDRGGTARDRSPSGAGRAAPPRSPAAATRPRASTSTASPSSRPGPALYRALTEPHAADARGPLLALSPVPRRRHGPPPSGGHERPRPVVGAAGPRRACAGPSGPDWVDPSAATIAAIERRLDQQIR